MPFRQSLRPAVFFIDPQSCYCRTIYRVARWPPGTIQRRIQETASHTQTACNACNGIVNDTHTHTHTHAVDGFVTSTPTVQYSACEFAGDALYDRPTHVLPQSNFHENLPTVGLFDSRVATRR